jgi:hypothetical protein
MPATTIDKAKLSKSYLPMRTRLLAKRKLEEVRLGEAREAMRRIDREIAALDRQHQQLGRG